MAVGKKLIVTNISDENDKWLEKEAKRIGISKSAVVKIIVDRERKKSEAKSDE